MGLTPLAAIYTVRPVLVEDEARVPGGGGVDFVKEASKHYNKGESSASSVAFIPGRSRTRISKVIQAIVVCTVRNNKLPNPLDMLLKHSPIIFCINSGWTVHYTGMLILGSAHSFLYIRRM